MSCVSRELGANLAKYRKRSGVTQQQLADRLTERTGRAISVHMVSAWERGDRDFPAAILPDICQAIHCSSFVLYPHSASLSDRDVQLIGTVAGLSDDLKDALFYMLVRWDGDIRARILLDAMHSALDKSLRYDLDGQVIDLYVDAIKRGSDVVDRSIKIDHKYVQRARKRLLDDDNDDWEVD